MKFFNRFQRKSLKEKLNQLEVDLALLTDNTVVKEIATTKQEVVQEVPEKELPILNTEASVASTFVPVEERDDLTKIKGIGGVTAQQLNELGFYTYEQMTVLSETDLEKIEGVIRFPGQVTRQDWKGQAEKLVALKAKK